MPSKANKGGCFPQGEMMKEGPSVVRGSCLKAGTPPSACTSWSLGFLTPLAVVQGPAESASPGSLFTRLTPSPARTC